MSTFLTSRTSLRDNWKHLRIPFQLTLAPIFLWGYAVSGARVGWPLLWGFIAFHFLLYPGITAYNSYYDRDEGSVGGMERPPDWNVTLLPLGLGLQLAGLVLTAILIRSLVSLYVVFMVLSVLYSHPATRWKAVPTLSALVVCGGQGGLGFLAGWVAGRGETSSAVSVPGVLGMVTAALTTFGMYPLTQLYQIDEDRRRGDRTLCVALGPERAIRLSQASFAVAGACCVAVTWMRYSAADAALMASAYVVLALMVERLKTQYASLNGREAFCMVMWCQYLASAAFTLFIGARLIRWA